MIKLLEFWALAFGVLCISLVFLNIFWNLIGQDLCLRSLGKEAIIAVIASLVEGAGVWIVVSYIPQGGRALFIPALIVAIIYKGSHLEDWGRYEIICFLIFQLIISAICANLMFSHFRTAFVISFAFFIVLAFAYSILKDL